MYMDTDYQPHKEYVSTLIENSNFAVPLPKEISLNGGRDCGDLDFFIERQ